jgi:hypothetical protein
LDAIDIGVVEDIKELGPEFDPLTLLDAKVLVECHIEVDEPRPSDDSSAGVPKVPGSRLRKGSGIELPCCEFPRRLRCFVPSIAMAITNGHCQNRYLTPLRKRLYLDAWNWMQGSF